MPDSRNGSVRERNGETYMKQTNRFFRFLLFFAGLLLLAGCTAKDTDPEPSEAPSVPTLSVEAPSPFVSAAPSPSPEAAPSTEPAAAPTPNITVSSYTEETGEIRTYVSVRGPQTGYSYSKEYRDGALVRMSERFYGSFTENDDSAHIERYIGYRDGLETFREEKRDILASNGQLLEQVEIVNGLYYYRGIEWLYTDGLQTGYYLYLGNHELLETGIFEYNEKKQLVYEKCTNVQTNRVVSEAAYEYYENGKEKVERRTEPRAYVLTRYESGRTHTFEGYNDDGVWFHYEYDEEGNRYEYDEEGNLIATVFHEPDEEGEG